MSPVVLAVRTSWERRPTNSLWNRLSFVAGAEESVTESYLLWPEAEEARGSRSVFVRYTFAGAMEEIAP